MKRTVWFIILLFLSECTKDDFKPSSEERCRIGRYVYDQESGHDKALVINYVENTLAQVDVVIDQLQTDADWSTVSIYKHLYDEDSLYIKDFTGFREGDTYVRAQYDSDLEQPAQMLTSFPGNGGTYRYTFYYGKEKQITVTLDKIDGSDATFDSRGVYYLDDNYNVSKLEITRNPALHSDDTDQFTTRTKTFTYDIVINPLRDLVVPHFSRPGLPDVTFFSMNNRLTEAFDGATMSYTYQYGTDPMPVKMTRPGGIVEKYEYNNCTN